MAGMLVRGWLRGFVRETLDLVGLVLGIWIAFRLSAPFGQFLVGAFDLSPEVARIGGGILLFVLFGAMLAIAAHYLSKLMNLPGLSMINRVGGAAVAAGWGILIVLVVVSLAGVLPLPNDWRRELDESNVVRLIAGENAVPRRVFESLAGDNVMAAMASIKDVFGATRAVPEADETLHFPPADGDEIRQVREEADLVLVDINERRVDAGLNAVTGVAPMTDLAEDRARRLYRSGELRGMRDCGAVLANRGYQVLRCYDRSALAGTASGALDGIWHTEAGRSMLVNPTFDRAGVAVVDGPTGRLVVIVMGG